MYYRAYFDERWHDLQATTDSAATAEARKLAQPYFGAKVYRYDRPLAAGVLVGATPHTPSLAAACGR